MAYYLNRRDQVPGWEVGSVMLFVMFCEIFYLLVWATIGFYVSRESLPEVFSLIPLIALAATVGLALWMLYFQGKILPGSQLREKRLLHAFKLAKPWHYGAFFLLRSPAIIAAVFVYTIALGLFGVDVGDSIELDFSGSDALDEPIVFSFTEPADAPIIRSPQQEPCTTFRIASLNTLFKSGQAMPYVPPLSGMIGS